MVWMGWSYETVFTDPEIEMTFESNLEQWYHDSGAFWFANDWTLSYTIMWITQPHFYVRYSANTHLWYWYDTDSF